MTVLVKVTTANLDGQPLMQEYKANVTLVHLMLGCPPGLTCSQLEAKLKSQLETVIGILD